MDETRLTVQVELLITPDSLRGHLIGPAGERTEFVGRVGLFAAVESLVEAAVAGNGEPQPTDQVRSSASSVARASNGPRMLPTAYQ